MGKQKQGFGFCKGKGIGRSFVCADKGIKIKRRKKLSSYEFIHKAAKRLRKHQTLSEIIMADKLRAIDMKFLPQYPIRYQGFMAIIDFYLHRLKIALEVDGGYHLSENQQQNDRVKDFILSRRKMSVLRITNEEAEAITPEDLKQKIQDFYLNKKFNRSVLTQVKDESLSPMSQKGLMPLGEEGSLPESPHNPAISDFEISRSLGDSQASSNRSPH